VHLSYAQVNLARGDVFEKIRQCFRKRCEGFDPPLQETDDGFVIELKPSPAGSTAEQTECE